jgi:hypothetical protein
MAGHDVSVGQLAAKVRGITGSQRVLLVSLASYPDRRIRLTMRQLARDVGTTAEDVARDVAALEDTGLLKVWRIVSGQSVSAQLVFVLPVDALTSRGRPAPGKATSSKAGRRA